MTLRTVVLLASVLTSSADVVADQPPPTAPRPAQSPRAATPQPGTAPATTPAPAPVAAPAPAPRRTGQPVNIKVDVTISDSAGSTSPTGKKTVSVVTGDNMTG